MNPFDRLPAQLLSLFLSHAAQDNLALLRRSIALKLLWQEGSLTGPQLQARVEAEAGFDCYGQQPALTLARDIKFIRLVLAGLGLSLKYRRRKTRPGYYLPDRPEFPPHLSKKIEAATREVLPQQARLYAQLSSAERIQQSAALSEALLSQAARRLQDEEPTLDDAAARRKALRRMYALERVRI